MRYYLLFFFFLLTAKVLAKPLDVSVMAESAVLMNAETGAILYQKNAHQVCYPASLTKVATALYALKMKGNYLDEVITAEPDAVASVSEEEIRRSRFTLPSHWLDEKTTHIGIKKGEKLTLHDLLRGMLIVSAADASNVIAQYVGGTIPGFVNDLNCYLQKMGCRQTFFTNPHGLHHPDHVTTAYEMALIAREALQDTTFRGIVKKAAYTRPQTNKQKPTTLAQTNRLVRKGGDFYYPKAIGVKTGYTSDAQHTYIAAAKDDDRTLIVVLMKCKEREALFRDAVKLFTLAFNEKKQKLLLVKAGPQKPLLMLPDAAQAVQGVIKEDVAIETYPSENFDAKCFLIWDALALPIKAGERVGELQFKNPKSVIFKTEPLYALADVSFNWEGYLHRYFGKHLFLKFLGAILVCTFLIGFRKRR